MRKLTLKQRLQRFLKLITVIFFFLLLWTLDYGLSTAYAEIPRLINYQGRLTDAQGKPITGTRSIKFRLYDQQAGGTMLWEETQTVTISQGVFNTLLGGTTTLNLVFDKPYFLETVIEGEVLSPRQQLASVGYAFRAKMADEALQAQNATQAQIANSISGILPISNGGTGNSRNDADTVDNFHASSSPAPNSLLVLDGNAKLPMSTLKVFDSGWFDIRGENHYSFDHNLGTTKVLITLYGEQSSAGMGYIISQQEERGFNGTWFHSLTPTSIKISTGNLGTGRMASRSGGGPPNRARLIMMALE